MEKKERKKIMICKNCTTWNDDKANFCRRCGGELHKNTVVTSAVTDRITAYNAPTSGIRVFSGLGNGYLQSAVIRVRNDSVPRSDAYHTHHTGAKVILDKSGSWICPDCGEKNSHEKLYCTGCGKYR